MHTKLFYKEIASKIILNLNNANSEIKIAVAWFTNSEIFKQLHKISKTRVKIELILCDDGINFKNSNIDFQKLIDLGANINISRYPTIMHNKFCLIDNKVLINGSYNWTLKAELMNLENIIISTDKELINSFNEYFKILKNQTDRITNLSEETFHDYYNKKEKEEELSLKTKVPTLPNISNRDENLENTAGLNEAIDKAELFYRRTQHKDCIIFCKEQIKQYPNIPIFHLFIAKCHWKRNEIKKLISSAKNAISIDNECYDAYNLLGIAYSHLSGREQQSIKNFNICLSEFPNEHAFLRNRAIVQIGLESDMNIPKKFRENYKQKANIDLEKIIQVVSNKPQKEQTYYELYSRAVAYSYLDKPVLALKDIKKAIQIYNSIEDEFELDKNEYIEMKSFFRELKSEIKANR